MFERFCEIIVEIKDSGFFGAPIPESHGPASLICAALLVVAETIDDALGPAPVLDPNAIGGDDD
ncbi:MAG: hypothetical protein WA993_08500 [Candidatus Binatus sp.]|jgi:alkylation response protein AidB-like acyl-CoA dehydrogenase